MTSPPTAAQIEEIRKRHAEMDGSYLGDDDMEDFHKAHADRATLLAALDARNQPALTDVERAIDDVCLGKSGALVAMLENTASDRRVGAARGFLRGFAQAAISAMSGQVERDGVLEEAALCADKRVAENPNPTGGYTMGRHDASFGIAKEIRALKGHSPTRAQERTPGTVEVCAEWWANEHGACARSQPNACLAADCPLLLDESKEPTK